MNLHTLIMPLGICTYISLLLTILTGLLIWRYHVKWIKMKVHIWLGVITLILGTLHAAVVIYLNL